MKQKLSKYRINLVAALLLLLCAGWLPSPLSSAHTDHADYNLVSTNTRAGRLAVFDDAWSTINERYYDVAFHGLDWNAQRTAFRDLAGEAESSQELYAILRRMIGGLNDPHTRVFSPEEKFDWWHPRFITIGLGIKEVDGLAVVVTVEPNSAPARAGIRPGDVIDSVDGTPALALIKQRLTSPDPTAIARSRAFATIFEGTSGTTVAVDWRNKRGELRRGRFVRYWQQRELGLTFQQSKGNVLNIEIDAFTRPIAISFVRLLKDKLKGSRGLVIDLRNNGGGDAEAMAEMAAPLVGTGIDLGEFTARAGDGFTISTNFQPLTIDEPPAKQFPIVILTSERTSSAAEIFTAALRNSKRALVMGTQTCGCVLAIRTRHNLPDGGLLDVSEMDYKTVDGERLEGNGLRPDRAVIVHRQDLYAKRDATLALALAQLADVQRQKQQ